MKQLVYFDFESVNDKEADITAEEPSDDIAIGSTCLIIETSNV